MSRMSVGMVVGVAAVGALLVVGCSGDPSADGPSSGPSSGPSEAAVEADSTVVLGGDALPDDWPAALPGFPQGALVSAALSEQATQINAVWHSDQDPQATWTLMDEELRSAGYATTADLDGTDNRIEDDTMISDLYRGPGFEVSVSVLAGDPVTVLLNASAL